MSLIANTTVVRGRFLDIQQTVSEPTDIPNQVRYLEDGLIGPDFVEDGESVTSKDKTISTSKLMVTRC